MKTSSLWFLTLALSVCGLVAIGAVLQSGCYYTTCDCPCLDAGTGDGGDGDGDGDTDGDIDPECQGSSEEINENAHLNAWIEGTSSTGRTFGEPPGNYVTLDPGGSLTTLTAVLDPEWEPEATYLPDECINPMVYTWEYGEGLSETGTSIGPITFTTRGTVSMTTALAAGFEDLTPAQLHVWVWQGDVFEDDFERATLDLLTDGYSERTSDVLGAQPSPPWDIVNGELHVNWGANIDQAYCQPGTQGLLTQAEALNGRVTVRQRRRTDTESTDPHYTDVLMRYRFLGEGPLEPYAPYYRVRIMEVMAQTGVEGTNCVLIDLFRIDEDDSPGGECVETEHAFNICDWPFGDDEWFTIDVSIQGTGTVTVEATVSSSSDPTNFTLTHTFTDSAANAVNEPGRFGLAQCAGESFFDDFRFQRL